MKKQSSDTPVLSNHLIQELERLGQRPAPFTPGEPEFWTDPHIARQMLRFHLDPDIEAASRRPETIQRSVAWIVKTLGLEPGDSLLDLGCGPGLYATLLAERGLRVTGIDFSHNSIDYAIQAASRSGLEIDYRCQDYLTLEDEAQYDVALLIYGDLCPLSPLQRPRLLANVRRALKPEGLFVLDVTTPNLRQREGLKKSWHVVQSGFWRPAPHLVLEQSFAYEGDIFLDQYIILEENGKISAFHNWFQDYDAERIRLELEANGFSVLSLWSDLVGTPYEPETEWIGVIARRS